ncbi:MAG: hypothetical protein US18_C0010G0012 [Parcubacteria group bacterium GW2011_GWB1_36_5]|nr:MAG: hypothetical protein US12_C0017G0012 [Parcubacteria group bacterium GW2011_GWA2_36_24]KKQ07700.1 MAG: hypothetical protein US18_C0010G0012 [Parcubacteria group bacterium GW2011_GWB1_36_5]
MPEGKDEKSNWFLWLIGVSCLITIFCTFYFFYYKKNYDFIVEVTCDPSKETCFQRDCSNLDDCPPNGLSDFKRYSLNARDFKMCENEDCASACETGTIKCELIECTENLEIGEFCSSLESSETN